MDKINKCKFLISVVLSTIIIFSSGILSATVPDPLLQSPAEHKKIIYQFISEIKDAQNQSANIAQSSLKDPAVNNNQLQLQLDSISSDLQALNERIEDYADTIQGLNPEDRQVRLTFNFLNLVRSNLYTLSLLIRATTDVTKIYLLDEFFRTRINAFNTLEILESIIEKYNT